MKTMTKEAFEQEVLIRFREQLQQYPAMRQQDVVKFVFQAMLGVGHLLSVRESAEAWIANEMGSVLPDPAEPLYEVLSPFWIRLNLRAAKERRMSPSVIAGLMFSSAPPMRFSRMDVLSCCRKLADSGENRMTDPDALAGIPDEKWLPSHSPEYRERYHPAYRVISAEWIPYMEAILRMTACGAERALITIDGPCASGKTTLAEKLAAVFGAAVVHTDDFVIPHAEKTAERLAVPGGNCDSERLIREVIAPWKQGESGTFRRYDCKNDRLLPAEKLPECRMLILEGSYSNLPVIRAYADVRLFMQAAWETRLERLQKRESEKSLQMFHARWIPLEDQYFKAYALPDSECVVVQ